MGKGDQRTRRGKLCRGTYGKTRKRRRKQAGQVPKPVPKKLKSAPKEK